MRAAALRSQIEQTLSRRVEAALTPRLRRAPDRLGTGIDALDRLLSGGFPAGAITELVGPQCSGRTALALSFAAARLQQGQVAAWIDASDTLDPLSAASLGVSLDRLLWIRCGETPTQQITQQEIAHAKQNSSSTLGSPDVSVDRSLSVSSQSGGGGSPHPRTEARGLPEALQTLIGEAAPPARTHPGGNKGLLPLRRRDKSIATPGAANRPLHGKSSDATGAHTASPQEQTNIRAAQKCSPPATEQLYWRSPYREEQAATDRLPARRGEQLAERTAASSRWSARGGEPQSRTQTGSAAASRTLHTNKAEVHSSGGDTSAPSAARPLTAAQATSAATTFFKQLSDDAGTTSRRKPSMSLRGVDQALRATDLLLQSSGFGVVVLDLASLAPETVWRIPLSTWFRYRAAAERTRTCFLLLTQHACARSSADLVLQLHSARFTSSGCVPTGIHWRASIARERFASGSPARNVVSIRKPPQSEHPGSWSGAAPWAPPSCATAADLDSPVLDPSATPKSSSPEAISPHVAANGKLATFRRRSA